MLFLRLVVDEAEDALRREQTRIQEFQQQLEQERAVSLRKDKEEEERRGVRGDKDEIVDRKIKTILLQTQVLK